MASVFEHEGAGSSRGALAALALPMLLASMGVSIANVALPTLATAFAASFQAVQWIVLGYLLATTVMVVGAGRLGDVIGHRRSLLAGLALFSAASLLCGVAPSLAVLIGARVAQGIGAAMLMAVTVALVRETVPKQRTGSAMGLLGTMSAIGTALGPSLGGVLIAGPGWRWIFLVMVPLGAVAMVLAFRHLPSRPPICGPGRPAGRLDVAGTVVLGLALSAYALSMTAGGDRFGPINVVLLAGAAIAAVLFVRIEARTASPLVRLAAFADARLGASLMMNGLVATVMMATLVVGPFYLARSLGLSEALVGLVMSVGPVISTISGVPAGRIVDRLGAPRVAIAGLAAMAIGAFALAGLPGVLGVAGYIAAIAVLTPGYQLFQAANNTMVMINVADDQRGVISGMLSLSRNLGLVTGASVMGAIFSLASGRSSGAIAGADAIAFGMRATFSVAGGAMLVAIAIGVVAGAFVTDASDRDGEPDR